MICSIVSRSGGIAMIGINNNSRSRCCAGATAMIYSSRHCLIASFASSSSASSNNNNNDKTNNDIELDAPQKTPPTAPARRRLRSSSSSSSNTGEPIPSLADFIHRAKVMKQYRKFVRLAHFIDGKDGTTTGGNGSSAGYRAALDEVRLSYKMKMTKQLDTISKTMALTEGERKMKEISTMVGYIAVHRSDHPQTTNNISKTGSSFDDDSWINIKDDEDKRGRMGVQWPWQKKEEEVDEDGKSK
jgi:hypothetical protein